MAWSHITADSNKIVVVEQKTVRRLLVRFPVTHSVGGNKARSRLDPHNNV
ncbi:MAG TPA: hypothetical protein VLJ17_18065 [Xanthobacteraceae bacterium]|nr:hypothetical protein [Xanthobacteraceae bacterium]